MIIALYGQSSSGKTTIANALRQHLGDCPTRHCGEAVKARERDLHLSSNDLPDEEHREIDTETRRWSENQLGLAIVEGRYLHCVLSQASIHVRLIEIVCDEVLREKRWAKRMGRALAPGELATIGSMDNGFAAKMYPDLSRLAPELKVDTTSVGVNDCVQQILRWLDQSDLR